MSEVQKRRVAVTTMCAEMSYKSCALVVRLAFVNAQWFVFDE